MDIYDPIICLQWFSTLPERNERTSSNEIRCKKGKKNQFMTEVYENLEEQKEKLGRNQFSILLKFTSTLVKEEKGRVKKRYIAYLTFSPPALAQFGI